MVETSRSTKHVLRKIDLASATTAAAAAIAAATTTAAAEARSIFLRSGFVYLEVSTIKNCSVHLCDCCFHKLVWYFNEAKASVRDYLCVLRLKFAECHEETFLICVVGQVSYI